MKPSSVAQDVSLAFSITLPGHLLVHMPALLSSLVPALVVALAIYASRTLTAGAPEPQAGLLALLRLFSFLTQTGHSS